MWGFSVFIFSVFSIDKNCKSIHHLLFLRVFPDLEMIQFWTVNYAYQVCKLYFYFRHVPNFVQCLLWVFSVNIESVLLLASVKFTLYRKIFCRKVVQNLLIFVYLFCLKYTSTDSGKNSITQEWLALESCPIPRWIAFLMLYRLAYKNTPLFQWTSFSLSAFY